MTPKIPVELAEARTRARYAWELYQSAVDGGKPKEHIDALHNVARRCDDEVSDWYARWQALGGTSDIASIVNLESIIPPALPRLTEEEREAEWLQMGGVYMQDWREAAALDHADWKDNNRTMEDARY